MKKLKQARESKKKVAVDSMKKIVSFPEMSDEMGNTEASLTLGGISEIEEGNDGAEEPANIIVVRNTSSHKSAVVKS